MHLLAIRYLKNYEKVPACTVLLSVEIRAILRCTEKSHPSHYFLQSFSSDLRGLRILKQKCIHNSARWIAVIITP